MRVQCLEGTQSAVAETEEVVSHDCGTYLQKLHTLMIAYALAGVTPLPGVGHLTKNSSGCQFYGVCRGTPRRAVAILLQGTEVSAPAACRQALGVAPASGQRSVGSQIPGEHPAAGSSSQGVDGNT